MDKVYLEGSEITLVFSYIREFMLSSVGKLLEKVDNWCCIHGVNVEIVVNDWAMVEMLCGKHPACILFWAHCLINEKGSANEI